MQQETDEGARAVSFCSDLTSFLLQLVSTAYCKGKSWTGISSSWIRSRTRKEKQISKISQFPFTAMKLVQGPPAEPFFKRVSPMAQLCIIGKIRTCGKNEQCTLCNSYRKSWIHSWENDLHGTAYLINSLILLWLLAHAFQRPNKIQIILMGIPSSPALLALFSQYDYGGAASIENVYVKLTKELI